MRSNGGSGGGLWRQGSGARLRAAALSAIPAACIFPIGCAHAGEATSQAATKSADHGIAWRMNDSPGGRVAQKRSTHTVVLTLGAGDRLGAQLEDVRVARAAAKTAPTATPSAVADGSESGSEK